MGSFLMDVIHQVKINLELQHLWNSVTVHDTLISGYPPKKLDLVDSDHQLEWIIPKLKSQDDVKVRDINSWFEQIHSISNVRPQRVTVALVDDDSTIVYYFIHDGIVKPRQN